MYLNGLEVEVGDELFSSLVSSSFLGETLSSFLKNHHGKQNGDCVGTNTFSFDKIAVFLFKKSELINIKLLKKNLIGIFTFKKS